MAIIKDPNSSKTAIEKAKNDIAKNNEGLINNIVNRKFDPTKDTGLTREDLLSGVNEIFSEAVKTFNPEKGEFGAYANQLINLRLPRIFDEFVETKVNEKTGKKEIIGRKDISDIQVEGETTQPSFALEPETKTSLKNKLFTAKLGFDKKLIPGDTNKTFADLFIDAVGKTLQTKLPDIKNEKQFKKDFTKKNQAEVIPILQELTKKDKDTGVDNFKIFLDQNFDAIINQLPQSVINKKYSMLREAVLDEDGKQKREGTKEGKGIFKRVEQEKSDFIDYFTNPDIGSSTRSDRKQSLLRTIADELSADAALDVIKDKNITDKFKEIQELEGAKVPEDFLDRLVNLIDRGIDYLDRMQK